MDDARIGPYQLGPLLGVGGMGEVYRAHDTRRDRDVALKLLPESLAHDEEYVARFRRESHSAARLIEPHVIPIHDYGEIDGRLFIDMRLVEGSTARELLDDGGRFTPERTAELVGQVADALAAAHADGLVHRDVKPSNVLVTPNGFAYVVDFGIARSIGTAQPSLTITGVTVGTLDYMAPERFMGADVDGRSDVYSLACLAHEFLTGERPFSGGDLPSLMYAHLYTEPPRIRDTVPDLSPEVDAVLARSMAKRSEDRHPDPRVFAAELRAALTAPTAPATPATPRAPAGEAGRETVGRPVPPVRAPGGGASGPAGTAPGRGGGATNGTPPPAGTGPRYDADRTGPVVLPRAAVAPPGAAAPPAHTPPPGDTAPPDPSAWSGPTARTGATGPPPGPAGPTTAPPTPAPASGGGPTPPAGATDGSAPRRTGRGRTLWITVAAVVAVVLATVGSLTGLLGPATVEVRLEPVGSAGPNPFVTGPAGVDRAVATSPTAASGPVRGTAPGLYALPANGSACNVMKIVDDLRADPKRATAWAAVQRIGVIDITTWLTGQTPVTLRADARATEYRYSDGRANAEPVVLQAGTTVLVDQYGAPVVKCTNGNPLALPAADPSPPTYTGAAWPGFAATRITIVARAPAPVSVIVVIDPATDRSTPLPRPDPAPAAGCTRTATGWKCVPVPDPADPPAAGCTVAGDVWSCPVTDPSAPPPGNCTRSGATWSCTPAPDPASPPRAGCTVVDGAWACPRSAAAQAAASDASALAAREGMVAPQCTDVVSGAPPNTCPAPGGSTPNGSTPNGLRAGTPAGQAPVVPAPGAGATGNTPEEATDPDGTSAEPGPESGTSVAPDPGTSSSSGDADGQTSSGS